MVFKVLSLGLMVAATLVLLKNKIQVSKFEDLIGFLQQLLNWAASRLESRKELAEAVENGRQKGEQEVSNQEWIVQGKVTFLWGKGWGLSCRRPH